MLEVDRFNYISVTFFCLNVALCIYGFYQTIYLSMWNSCFITNEMENMSFLGKIWSQKSWTDLIWQSCYNRKWLLVVNYTNVPINELPKGLTLLSLQLFISLEFLLHTCYKISSDDSIEKAPCSYSRSQFLPSRYELVGIYIQ